MRSDLVLDALHQALQTRPTDGTIFHSERGSQYGSAPFRQALAHAGLSQSMSARANPYDNAWTESFIGSLKREMLQGGCFEDAKDARIEIFEISTATTTPTANTPPSVTKPLTSSRLKSTQPTKQQTGPKIGCTSGRTAMELMRHSDPKLTFNNYNDRTRLPKWEIVKKLPVLFSTDTENTRQRTHVPEFSCPVVSPAVTDGGNGDEPETPMDKGFWLEVARSGIEWHAL